MAEILIVAGVSAFMAWMWPGKSEADAKKELEKMKAKDPALIALYTEMGTKMTQIRAIAAKIPDSVTMDDAWVKRKDWEQTLTAGGNKRPRPVAFEGCVGMKHAATTSYKEALLGSFDYWRDAIAGGATLSGWQGDTLTPVQHAREIISHIDGRTRDAARLGYR
jgi:hypothetical protein